MIYFKDRAFCASPDCKNDCGRKMTDEEKKEWALVQLPISFGYFCGKPKKFEVEVIDDSVE